MTRLFVFVALVLAGAGSALLSAQSATPILADRFADSIGVNVHLHATDTPYGNFELVRTRLGELGIRHVRDGLIPTTWQPYFDRHNALGAMGIRGLFIAAPNASDQALRDFPARTPGMFFAYEAPNEYDASGVASWTSTLRQSLTQLLGLRAIAHLSSFQVYGPSLTSESAYVALGDVSQSYDVANLHNYMAGRHPGTGGWGSNGYGSIDWNLGLARRYAPNRPIVSTETGYWDDPAVVASAPPAIVARYLPRLLLEQYRKGIIRSYLYELIDDRVGGIAGRSGYGLLRADGSPKPAFGAVANLLRVMNDRGAQPAPQPFAYSRVGGDANVREMLFQKRDGSRLLALWVESSGYDVVGKKLLTVPPQSVYVSVPATSPLLRIYRWRDDGTVGETVPQAGQTSMNVSINDSLTLLHFR